MLLLMGERARARSGPHQAEASQGDYKIKAKGSRALVRDKSKPVRKALEAQYARLAEAIQNKDFNSFQDLRMPDFSTVDINGQRQTPEQMAARARSLLQRIHPPIRVSFDIGTINVTGDEATATIRQSFSRMQDVAGRMRRVETSVTQEETWVKTEAGWKLRHVGGERDMEWYVDGKRIEPGRPYDPDAPPYDPKKPEN